MGNAVCPQVASALGRCLALAALHESPPGEMLIFVRDAEYDKVGTAGTAGLYYRAVLLSCTAGLYCTRAYPERCAALCNTQNMTRWATAGTAGLYCRVVMPGCTA